MSTDAEMKNSYIDALRDAQNELAGMNNRRRALQATIEGLKRLLTEEEQFSLGADVTESSEENGASRPTIPPGFFKGKRATQAYRDFVGLWGADHPMPEIRDALIAGGIEAKSESALLQQLHSVKRRERKYSEMI